MPLTQPRILVPIQDAPAESDLVRLAASLATPPWGELHLTHVLTDKSPPPAEVEAQLRELAEIALQMDVGAIVHVERGADVSTVISDALSRWNCTTMVMGWKADIRRDAVLAASNRALTKTGDVDTLIFKNRGFGAARRISVPTGGGSHAMMGMQIAYNLAQRWESHLKVIRVARDSACDPADPVLARYCRQLDEDTQLQLRMLGIQAEVSVIPGQQVVESVIQRVRGSDMIVLGASNDWRQEEHLAGSIPDEIASQASCSVLMVRAGAADGLSLTSIFWENTIRLDLHPADKWQAIQLLVDALVDEKQIPLAERDNVLTAAVAREHTSSTAMGHGTAIPHAPMPELPGIIGCMGICPDGVDFDGEKEGAVRFVFLLLTPEQNYRNYIPVLSQIAGLIRPPERREALLSCQTPREVVALMREAAATPT